MSYIVHDPNMSAKKIAKLVKAKGLYRSQPSLTHFRSVRRDIMRYMTATRAVDMAAMHGYIDLLIELA